MATSATLDGIQINGNDTRGMNAFDWGGAAIAQLLFTGDLRENEYDQYLADQRATRQVTYPFRLTGSSVQDVYQTLGQIQAKLAAANRYAPLEFVVMPIGASVATTFKAIGGYVDTTNQANTPSHDSRFELSDLHPYEATLYLECLPWAYGPTQTYGSAASPLRAMNTNPDTFDVTPVSGAEGDVPGDVTVYLQADPSNGISSLMVGTTSGQVINPFIPVDQWTLNNGTIFAGDIGIDPSTFVVRCQTPGSNTIQDVATYTLPTNWPSDRPFRAYLRARDNSLGSNRFRIKITCGQQIIFGDWAQTPTGSYPNGSQYFGFDMGVWFFPPAPVPSGITATVKITIQQQSATLVNACFYDFLALMPDDSFLLSEPASNTAIALASDIVQVDSGGVANVTQQGVAGPVTIGATIRSRGPLRVCVIAATGLITPDSTSVVGWSPPSPEWSGWASYTPRYVELAS